MPKHQIMHILIAVFTCFLQGSAHAAGIFDRADPTSAVRTLANELQALVNGSGYTQQADGTEFDHACRGWGAPGFPSDFARKAAIVLQAEGSEDVQTGVRFAQEKGIPIAVKGGGHSTRNLFIADGGLTLDLSRMKGIRVNAEQKTATVQGGVVMDDVLEKTRTFNLAPSWGQCGGTGLGTPLGGGSNLLEREAGIGADNILSVQMVLANASLIIANASHNQEVLGVVRGGASALGVVVEMTIQLVDVSGFQGAVITVPDPSTSVLKAVFEWSKGIMDIQPRIGLEADRSPSPEGEMSTTVQVAMLGQVTQADRDAVLSSLRKVTNAPQDELDTRLSYYDLVAFITNGTNEAPYLSNQGTNFVLSYDQVTDSFLDLVNHWIFDTVPAGVVSSTYWDISGNSVASNAVGNTTSLTPFAGDNDVRLLVNFYWPPGQNNEEVAEYVDKSVAALAPYVLKTQAYANAASVNTSDFLVGQVGGYGNLLRFRATKKELDPTNLFAGHAFVGLWTGDDGTGFD